MKRITMSLIAAAAAAAPAAVAHGASTAHPAAVAHGAPSAHAAGGAKLQIRHTSLGSILANGRGLTVYMFTRDSIDHDSCVAMNGCTGIWPPVTSNGAPTPGPGVKRSLLGTTTLPGGTRQVTYAGHPLYTYIGDSGPGDTEYVGQPQFGGHWFALSPAGRVVK